MPGPTCVFIPLQPHCADLRKIRDARLDCRATGSTHSASEFQCRTKKTAVAGKLIFLRLSHNIIEGRLRGKWELPSTRGVTYSMIRHQLQWCEMNGQALWVSFRKCNVKKNSCCRKAYLFKAVSRVSYLIWCILKGILSF